MKKRQDGLRRRRRARAQRKALAWLGRNPEAREWQLATVVKVGLLVRGRLSEAQEAVASPARLRRFSLTR